MTGVIFDIKEFSIHDGPGSRITVFLKGCSMRCLWCHNPEGLSTIPQLMYRESKCVHCGACKRGCSHPECEPFGRCVHSCPNGCLSIAGETVSSDDLAERLRENKDFLTMTGGGITISGGEPLIQHEFIVSLCRELKGIHLALQTGGYASKEVYKDVVGRFDYIMQDIKLADEEEHIKYTGVSNIPILENIEYLMKSGKEYVFRVPLIPGITDTDNNLKSIARIVGNSKVELLPYNTLAGAKYAMLGMNYTLENEGNRDIDYTAFFLNAVIR